MLFQSFLHSKETQLYISFLKIILLHYSVSQDSVHCSCAIQHVLISYLSYVKVAQLCLTLCDPMNYIAHQAPLSMGILQARILEWAAVPSSRGSSQPRD